MFNGAITADRSLRGADLVSGSLDFDAANISGSVSFHTSNASDFVDAYNTLDDASEETPLALNAPIANGLSQVGVTIPTTPINKTGAALITSRNTLKKLFPGMQAHDYAEDVVEGGNKPLLNMTVLGEDVGANKPGSVFIRWEFKDQAAIDAFNANELPPGYTLADLQFLESDTPAKFMALNIYHGSGGSVFEGVRAEWDIFVDPPVGADPDAGTRPRFLVRDALAEAISADSMHGLTPPEPLSYQFVGDNAEIYVGKMEDDVQVDVFEAAFPTPDPATAPVARFTREMAISNDYIYWANGVYDRAEYNASTFNYDSYFVEPLSQVQITRNDHWAQYLADDPTYVVYYTNTLEYIASPWDNLDSPYLNFMFNPPGWLAELEGFKYNGHELAWMQDSVQSLFRGQDDSPTPFIVENTTPATYYNFEITDPTGMAAALNLPPGYSLAPTRFFKDIPGEAYYLTLSVYEIKDSVEGTRAEWSVYADDGGGREHLMIIDLQTEDAAVDPLSMMNLPSKVDHDLTAGTLSTTLSSLTIDFDAEFDTAGATEEDLSLNWIEAGEEICHLNGICDMLYYDAETLDVPVHLPASVTVNSIETPWDAYINATPSAVFYRDNLQEYVVKPWQNLKVYVEDPPPPPICFEGTHTVTGTGTLTGRDSSALDSTYTYYGGGSLDGDIFAYIEDNSIVNILGTSHIVKSISFDLPTGLGEQTVLSCTGSALMCADVTPLIGTPEATTDYVAENVDATDPNNITWEVNFELYVESFGWADSASSFTAALGDPATPENTVDYCSNGVDDDCDGDVDCDDSDCSAFCYSYGGVANAEASSYGSTSLTGSGTFNALTLVLVPIGALIFLRVLRRKK